MHLQVAAAMPGAVFDHLLADPRGDREQSGLAAEIEHVAGGVGLADILDQLGRRQSDKHPWRCSEGYSAFWVHGFVDLVRNIPYPS